MMRHPGQLCLQAGLGVAVQCAKQLGIEWIWERMQQHVFPRLSVLHDSQCTRCCTKRTEVRACTAVLQAGLGVAVQYANQLDMEWIWERVRRLAAELRSKLSHVPGVTVQDRGRVLCGIVSFTKVSPSFFSVRNAPYLGHGAEHSTNGWHSDL